RKGALKVMGKQMNQSIEAQQMSYKTEKEELISINKLKKHFPIKNGLGKTVKKVKAINDVSFSVYKGETFGLVGESGCGKSTTGRSVLRLIEPTAGDVFYKNKNILTLDNKEMKTLRRDLQMVFQDPYTSLNPRKLIGNAIKEVFQIHNISSTSEHMDRVLDLLNKVGLRADQYFRYPHEFSGGQRQRIGLARALAVDPDLIVCDEPVSALDVS